MQYCHIWNPNVFMKAFTDSYGHAFPYSSSFVLFWFVLSVFWLVFVFNVNQRIENWNQCLRSFQPCIFTYNEYQLFFFFIVILLYRIQIWLWAGQNVCAFQDVSLYSYWYYCCCCFWLMLISLFNMCHVKKK